MAARGNLKSQNSRSKTPASKQKENYQLQIVEEFETNLILAKMSFKP